MQFEHQFPEVPVDLSGVASDEIRAFQALIDQALQERIANEDELSDEDLEAMESFAETYTEMSAELEARETAAAERKNRLDGIRKSYAPRPAVPAKLSTTEPEPEPGPDEPLPDDEPDDEEDKPELSERPRPKIVAATSARNGTTGYQIKVGEEIITSRDLGEAILARASMIQPGAGDAAEKFMVATIHTDIPEDRYIPEDVGAQIALLSLPEDQGLTAAFCPPPTPVYDFVGGSQDNTPAIDSLSTYGAPRGRVLRMGSPLLADIDDDGIGFWTAADDTNPSSFKDCSVITCPDDETFEIYGVYKCVEVDNLMALTYPELVAFFLRQLSALHARKRELKFLDAMLTRAGGTAAAITTTSTYGSEATLLSRMNEIGDAYTENERYAPGGLRAWMPNWVPTSIQNDYIRRGAAPPSVATINGRFRDIGIDPVWVRESPTAITGGSAGTLYGYTDGIRTTQATGGALVTPQKFWALLSRAGNWRRMDIGQADLGLTTFRQYRDTAMLRTNKYRLFMETFEGFIDMGLPNWFVTIDAVCGNGLVAPASDFAAKPCGATDETT